MYYIAVTGLDVLTDMRMVIFESIKYIDRVCCNSGYLRNTQNNTHTHTDDWANAAVASCRHNLNTGCHVYVLCR